MVEQLASGEQEVLSWVKKSKTISNVVKIPGDASARKYYRIYSSDGSSHIVMKTDPFTDQGEEGFPFLIIQKHLNEANIPVPKIIDVDPARGFVLLEDLGDATLLKKLQNVSSPEIERGLYEKVLDVLVDLQVYASPGEKPAEIEAYNLRFDHTKLMWEVNHTIEHFYERYLGRNISTRDREVMVQSFSEICQELANEPTVLTHRDFHSRNVMVVGAEERLVLIDFQDARMGPVQYDLASLLRDSYYQIEETQVEKLVDYYIARLKAHTDNEIDRVHFLKIFDFMSIQRNFKAIGSFASFLNRRGDATYLKYIGNTFENIRRNLLKHPRYSDLREVLFHYYYF